MQNWALQEFPLITDPVLGDTRIILVSPKTPGNIGAVCRVAANFEVSCSVLGAALHCN